MEGVQGRAEFTLVAEPATFKTLPWSPRTGCLLCDAYMDEGKPCLFATRQILQRAVSQLEELGLDFIAGLEVEFPVFELDDPRLGLADSGQPDKPPRVWLLSHGHQYATELRYDRVEPVMELLRSNLDTLGLPLRSPEIGYGPSHFELSFGPTAGVLPADTMVQPRSAIEQICQRAGNHPSVMCRPHIPNVMSSGWHLHQSMRQKSDGINALMPDVAGQDRASFCRRAFSTTLSTGFPAHLQGVPR